MFIRYDLLELIDFFGKEPTYLYEEEAGVFMFSVENGEGFSLLFHVDTYAKKIHVEVTYGTSIVFSGVFADVITIRRSERVLIVDLPDEKKLIIQKGETFGVVIEGTM
ncbi:MAG: hypothetical protein J5685_02850 [Clostridiales bacterium]|nr:hypothetical protein [Clostridiales bacterium]